MENCIFNFYGIGSGFLDGQDTVSYSVEKFLRIDSLWTNGAVLLADYTGLVHRPRKTPVTVKKGSANPDWPDLGKLGGA